MTPEKELNIIIANNIKSYLEDQKKTQEDLAQHMGVSQATVSNWCQGVKMPRMDKFDRICKYFGVNRSDLMTAGSPEVKRSSHVDEIISQLPEDLQGVTNKYRALDSKGKELVDVFLEHEYQRCTKGE